MTDQNLTDKCHLEYSVSDIKKFVESCTICQATNSYTQIPAEVLTPLTVPQRPWIDIVMALLFLKQLLMNSLKVISGMILSDKQKRYFVIFCQVLNIIDRYVPYMYIIHGSGDSHAVGVIDIFQRHIKHCIELPFSTVTDQHVLFVSTEFQDCTILNRIRHEVSATYHAETGGQTERKTKELTEICAVHALQGTDLLTAAPKL